MSHHLPLHPAQLEVVVSSKPLDSPADSCGGAGRSWLVTVRTRLETAYIDLARSTSACQLVAGDEIDGQQQQLAIRCLGQPDPYSALYSVSAASPPPGQEDGSPPKLRVRLTPRYHSATGTAFRLDDKLAALVGRSYLVHPKYALSVVLAYARAHSLDRDRVIQCDPQLEALLGCRWVKKQQLWSRLETLVGRFHQEAVSLEHTLAAPKATAANGSAIPSSSTTAAVLDVACDREANLFPADWNHVGSVDQRTMHKTRTASFDVAKSGAGGGPTSTSSRAGSLLRRHKTI
jgi:hypothetical protein